ncbi:Nucleoside permease NupC [Enhygromyxa salina]|uniref:Nucleoside permease NupC n=1 Tax=Enhygromyxa salina TaxID=215803 RepID=A0A0C1ZN43_9BACT|nr:nucleoside transporter C-terminal domain-containing protein [Enhygromyxa salina]KIG18889.1 Nucleoside permease NupC [Enhygromyxa salina]
MGLSRIVSIFGALTMLAIAYALSSDRKRVSLRVVLWGVGLQWAFAALLLWVPAGKVGLEALAGFVTGVLAHSYAGSEFLFGSLGAKSGGESGFGVVFAFQILPTIVFVAALFAVLYHLGVMQLIVGVLAKVMVATMGTSGAESLSVGAAVFMGQTEAPLTIRPFLEGLTKSELFLVMVSGMATVSGAILAAYVMIGNVEMKFLLAAVAMTAPACVVTAKLMIPEDDKPVTLGQSNFDLPKDEDSNLLLAAANGTTDGLKLAVNVGAMLIAFIALVSLINAGFGLIEIGGEPLTLQRMLGWIMAPVAFLMGVPWSECITVGGVLGTRTVVNEIVAFIQLSEVMGSLSTRSHQIATFAVCGFANVSSIGIQIGGLGALAPSRRGDIANLGVRALIAATLANFMTACVAGALLAG